MSDYRISYAQNREDVLLDALLKDIKKGFYVDVGANHPVVDSVTKNFYDRGWTGINLEPANKLHAQLELARPRDINLKLGVSDTEGELSFREYTLGDGLSTFSEETQKAYEKDESYRYFAKDYVDHKVPVTTLAKILAKYAKGKQIDFMKIDVEGYEYEAVAGNDWEKYRPVILCIEANHVFKDWHPILKKAGYTQIFWDGLNEYFVAREHADIVANFSYADSIFFSTPYISWSEFQVREDLGRDKALLEYRLERCVSSLTQANQSTAPAQNHSKKTNLKRGLAKIDRKVTGMLEPKRPSLSLAANEHVSTTLEQAISGLKQQLQQTVPVRQKPKTIIAGGYKLGKRTIRKVVGRRLQS